MNLEAPNTRYQLVLEQTGGLSDGTTFAQGQFLNRNVTDLSFATINDFGFIGASSTAGGLETLWLARATGDANTYLNILYHSDAGDAALGQANSELGQVLVLDETSGNLTLGNLDGSGLLNLGPGQVGNIINANATVSINGTPYPVLYSRSVDAEDATEQSNGPW
ncbi:MAG: hypothetical protein HRU10_14455, partial [Opitutales bacterium]|nr:hypothetical protein [Opitutales bacterium]